MRSAGILPVLLSASQTYANRPSAALHDAQQILANSGLDLGRGLDGIEGWNYWENAQGIQGCAVCETLILGLKLAAFRGDDYFVDFTTRACKQSGVEDDDVCEGTIALEGPIVARGLRQMVLGGITSRQFCVSTLGLCAHPKVDPFDVPFPSPKPPESRPPPSGQEPLYVVHYSDIHVDPFYSAGTDANCTKPICCRDFSATDPPNEFPVPAGPHGDHQCDSPRNLEESMHAAITRIVPGAAFSIFTGDIVDHAVWNTSQSQNTADIEVAYQSMSKAGIPVYGTAGNHESSPTNSYPPTGTSDEFQWIYDTLSSMWSRWISPAGVRSARDFGAYSVKHPGFNLRIISLNTNLHYAQNYWLYEEPMLIDPSGHVSWLIQELDAAERAGERVYIIGHMPLGAKDAIHQGSNHLDQIVNRYSSTIAALFFGHTHFDEFEITYSNYTDRSVETARAMSYIGPSLTPTSGHPSFRVYAVDPVTFGVLDAVTYSADMGDPDFQLRGPVWKRHYSARETYGPLLSPPLLGDKLDTELTPAFWHQVTEALENNKTAFARYFERRSRGWVAGDECSEDDDCRAREICKLRAARAQDNCIIPTPRVDLGRRRGKGGWQAEQGEDECEKSVTREVLSSVSVQMSVLRMFLSGELASDIGNEEL